LSSLARRCTLVIITVRKFRRAVDSWGGAGLHRPQGLHLQSSGHGKGATRGTAGAACWRSKKQPTPSAHHKPRGPLPTLTSAWPPDHVAYHGTWLMARGSPPRSTEMATMASSGSHHDLIMISSDLIECSRNEVVVILFKRALVSRPDAEVHDCARHHRHHCVDEDVVAEEPREPLQVIHLLAEDHID